MKKNNYTSPLLSMTALSVENGFAGSSTLEKNWWHNETNDVNIGWSYSDDETWE